MKQLLLLPLTTIAAVLLVGCGPSVDIHQAAKDGNIEAVKQHIAIGTDVNVMNNAGGTPLHMAVFWGRSEIAELLIDAGADVNVNGDTGFTPLDVITHPGFPSRSPAPKAARKEIADLLRKHGGKTREELKSETPTAKAPDISIHKAVHEENIEAVKQAIADGADVNAKVDKWGETPLHIAAINGRKETVELLIAEGADVNAKMAGEMTPLYYAATSGRREVVELLIAKGADVNAKDDDDKTPLEAAEDYPETADLLRKHGGKHGTIHGAAGGGDIEAVKEFLASGTDVNATNGAAEWAPLHAAAGSGHKEIVLLLIAKGADVNAKNRIGQPPLDYAKRHPETADVLRKHGGKTGDELKAAEPVAEAVKPKPPTTKAPDISIHDAAKDGNIKAVKQHLAAGVDVDVKDNHGRTSLLMAAWWDHKETVELLIGAGADVNAMAGNGVTPLDLSIKLNLAEITDLIRKHGGKTGEELEAEGK